MRLSSFPKLFDQPQDGQHHQDEQQDPEEAHHQHHRPAHHVHPSRHHPTALLSGSHANEEHHRQAEVDGDGNNGPHDSIPPSSRISGGPERTLRSPPSMCSVRTYTHILLGPAGARLLDSYSARPYRCCGLRTPAPATGGIDG